MRFNDRHPSRFVKASDLKPKGAVVVIDRLEMEDVGQGADKKTKPVLYFANASKALVLNAVNDEQIGKILGTDDDKQWRGKRVELFPTTTTFGKKVVDCVRVRAVDGATTAADVEDEDENPAPPDDDVPPDMDDEIPF
jgi:hypothetical protein